MKRLILCSLLVLTSNALSKTHIVKAMDSSNGKTMVFEPTYIKIETGDEIKFVPESKGHNSQSVFTPEGARGWVGKVSKEITVKFEKSGFYIYECMNHGVMGMAGVVEVGAASNKKEAADYLKEKLKKKMVMNKNRLDAYLNK